MTNAIPDSAPIEVKTERYGVSLVPGIDYKKGLPLLVQKNLSVIQKAIYDALVRGDILPNPRKGSLMLHTDVDIFISARDVVLKLFAAQAKLEKDENQH